MILDLDAIILNLNTPIKALPFYQEWLACTPEKVDTEQIILQVGLLKIILQRSSFASVCTLSTEVEKIGQSTDFFLAQGGKILQAARHTQQRKTILLEDPFGHQWICWRPLLESELPQLPALPITKQWPQEVQDHLQTLLKEVPEGFRKSSRKIAVLEAEFLAEESVSLRDATRGFIRSAPYPLREQVKPALQKNNLNWRDFAADFEDF